VRGRISEKDYHYGGAKATPALKTPADGIVEISDALFILAQKNKNQMNYYRLVISLSYLNYRNQRGGIYDDSQ